ncbi:signal recognition particle 54 kDa protein 2-like [Trifolium pratense]|uniref:Signal recognition particle 54 kDa protein 2-like n=1 Tax=Trifolium pratense TaxID=57577 RepID=A0A2K3NC65_TRIPR|nr:signal recognition particle 54 kDa protein 2-like [Trifolium pratense]
MGDLSGLMDRIHKAVPVDQQAELHQKRRKLHLEDYVFSMLPGFSAELMPKGREKESQMKVKQLDSSSPKLMNESRMMRIARGSGYQVREVLEMVEEYKRLANIWKRFKMPKGFAKDKMGMFGAGD